MDFREGTTSTYAVVLQRFQSRAGEVVPDSLVETARDTVRLTVVDTDAALGNRRGLIRIDGVSQQAGRSREWYRLTDTSLEEIAYARFPEGIGGFWVQPLRPGAPGSSGRSGGDESCDADGEVYDETGTEYCVRDDARLTLRFPLAPDASWEAFADPFTQQRTVVGLGETEVAAGSFATAEVRTEWPGASIYSTERVGTVGVVSREIAVEYAGVTGPDGQPQGGTVREVVSAELIGLERP